MKSTILKWLTVLAFVLLVRVRLVPGNPKTKTSAKLVDGPNYFSPFLYIFFVIYIIASLCICVYEKVRFFFTEDSSLLSEAEFTKLKNGPWINRYVHMEENW